jgi:folylpolyglutamate synthase/dihydropteroate synthase
MWFETLIGCPEGSPQQVRENIVLDGELLKSRVNGKVVACGRLETPSLAEIRERVKVGGQEVGKLSVREVVANVQDLHKDVSNAESSNRLSIWLLMVVVFAIQLVYSRLVHQP